MAKFLLLKHYRGAPAPVNDIPMDQRTPGEVDAHIQFMRDFATRLEGTGESSTGKRCRPRASGSDTAARDEWSGTTSC